MSLQLQKYKMNPINHKEMKINGKTYQVSTSLLLDIVITDNCNRNCKFCINGTNNAKMIDYNILLKRVSEAVEHFEIKGLTIVGGEPTTYPKLLDFLKEVQKYNFEKILIITNGIRLLYPEYIDNLLPLITDISISVPTNNNELHLDVTGVPLIEKSHFKKLFDKANNYNVNVEINTLISHKLNSEYSELQSFIDYYSDVCHIFRISPLLNTYTFGTSVEIKNYTDSDAMNNKEINNIFEKIINHKEYNLQITNNLSYGFIKQTLIYSTPLILLNYNHRNLKQEKINNNEVNTLKLLSSGDLSFDWNLTESILFN